MKNIGKLNNYASYYFNNTLILIFIYHIYIYVFAFIFIHYYILLNSSFFFHYSTECIEFANLIDACKWLIEAGYGKFVYSFLSKYIF